jgi:hypothetical protein
MIFFLPVPPQYSFMLNKTTIKWAYTPLLIMKGRELFEKLKAASTYFHSAFEQQHKNIQCVTFVAYYHVF